MKDCQHLAIWTWLLLNVVWKETDVLFQGKRFTLKAGQMTTGIKVIANELSISQSKVQRVLKFFETEKQIEQQTTTKCRLITVKNWEQYQENEKQNDKQLTNDWKTNDKQLTTKEDSKNIRIEEVSINNISIQNNIISNANIVSGEKNKILAADAPTPAQEARLFFVDIEKQEKIIDYLIGKGINEQVAKNEIIKFISYWTEPTRNGTKQRWELEKAFEIRRRLATWFQRANRNIERSNNSPPKGIAL